MTTSGTDTPIIMGIVVFQLLIVLMMGFIGQSMSTQDASTSGGFQASDPPSLSTNPLSIFDMIGQFFSGLSFSFSNLPLWANALIFLPLEFGLGFIIVKLIVAAAGGAV